MRIGLVLYAAFVTTWASCIATTGWWTITGHCCGMFVPFITGDALSCLPAGDHQWPEKILMSGRCGTDWRRSGDYPIFMWLASHGNGKD